ncbi:hypothetical protein FNV43_RR21389 [Rhamnella rubrinervis]|uniref:Glycosyltransferase 61 catalytic domain-containing protein n=1 Tax=Rhamnella rubrinervis TaxID=2594499 RepID=A0A8K0GV15_9ROSA|nr:hypothetical protein FNV43_RR21389 [Rhamnella rubrinervis]
MHEKKKLGYGASICCLLIVFCFCSLLLPYLGPLPALNLQVSMGVGLNKLALKATNTSQKIFGGKHDLGLMSSKVVDSTNVSFQIEKSTSNQNYDLGRSIKVPKNVSLEIVNSTSKQQYYWGLSSKGTKNMSLEIENSTSQHYDWGLSSTGSKNVSLQVENSTSSLPSSGQHAEKPIEENEINVTKKTQPLCNTGEPRTDFCEIKMNVRIDGNSASVFAVSSQTENSSWSIKPYGRKDDPNTMRYVRKWSVKSANGNQEIPKCTITHNVPAVLFSTGGYIGNHFHDFTDVLIPLFITSRPCNGQVQLLVSDKRPWWISKFQEVLKRLSKYDIIDIDKEQQVHCFPSATIGLKRHPKELSIDPLKHSYSIRDFTKFLRSTYSLKRTKAIKTKHSQQKSPRLLIISRKRTRTFTNIEEISRMARSLGYEVIVSDADMSLPEFAELVNSCDALMGVHGAGLTNMVFLPENAVFIQILGIGMTKGMAMDTFGDPAKGMRLKYLEYDIDKKESTLIKEYPPDHVVFTDPSSIRKQGWVAYGSVYLDKQNINLDVNRFKPTLLKALKLLHH